VQSLLLPKIVSTQCPYEISTSEYERIRSTIDLADELLRIRQDQISHLEGLKKILERKLVGLRFNLEDHIIAMKEDKEESASATLIA
jgi:hypothetical protein